MKFERVLLIDDNETDNFFHSMALKKAGFSGELLVFDQPADALAYLLKDQISVPTCVLLDINMPQINGFEVARTLAERLNPRAGFSLFMLSSSNWTDDALVLLCHKRHNTIFSTSSWRIDECSQTI